MGDNFYRIDRSGLGYSCQKFKFTSSQTDSRCNFRCVALTIAGLVAVLGPVIIASLGAAGVLNSTVVAGCAVGGGVTLAIVMAFVIDKEKGKLSDFILPITLIVLGILGFKGSLAIHSLAYGILGAYGGFLLFNGCCWYSSLIFDRVKSNFRLRRIGS